MEAEKRNKEELQNDQKKKHLEEIENQPDQNTEMMQEVKYTKRYFLRKVFFNQEMNPKSSYMGRTSTGSGRQHPVNSICMCSRCVEQLNDLHSSRGYKNSESPHSMHSEVNLIFFDFLYSFF